MVFKPTKTPNKPPDSLSDYTMMIAGPKKIGKTALACEFPNIYIAQGEPGNSRAFNVPQDDFTKWEDFLDLISYLEKDPFPKTVLVDDIPSFYDLASTYTNDELGITHESDLSYAKGWKTAEKELSRAIRRLCGCPFGLLFTAHTVNKEIETRSKRKFYRLETGCSRAADRLMDSLTQIWGVIEWHNGKRYMQILGDEYIKAGQGVAGHFISPDGKDIRYIPLGNSARDGYLNLVKAFKNKLDYTDPEQNGESIPEKKSKSPQTRFTFKKG